MADKKIYLSEKEIPEAWYNIQADLPQPLAPPLNPKTGQPLGPEDLLAIFPESLIKQEMSTERWIEIPEQVREIYKIWRPSPLKRATRLEKALKTPARIYFKDESVSPAGSHKPNTSVAQAYFNKEAGVLFTRTEGIIPAPESSHAIRAAIDEALKCKETGEEKCIVFCLSGHGHFDMSSYDAYFEGNLTDYAYPEEKIREALKELPDIKENR
ncbi:MAG: hypothetical protein COS41_00425 [Elusimicrobia bacterium CG03_land_8_20_14_0_80_50_18]|nr:MAG: hypothetical protein COS41_00425 [Elusimicrobia bacterium CG03_land_8_20_14_0_80_50_18]PIX14118.1 MAG: hypothetical protein COZ72_06805 [Elusimicrobia bacterium CG_4_8_14_3_um_filter_50_9]